MEAITRRFVVGKKAPVVARETEGGRSKTSCTVRHRSTNSVRYRREAAAIALYAEKYEAACRELAVGGNE